MSKKVYLRRKEILNHLPKEVRAEAVMRVSSVFLNRQPLKGLDPDEEKELLNGILDVGPDHVEWPKHVKTFWTELTIPVGFAGVELEIGKDDSGNPIQILDYLKYRFALRHPHVALSKEEMDSSFSKRFYIQDTTKEDLQKNTQIHVRKDADKEFIKISSDPKNMKRVLRLVSSANPSKMSIEQVENTLYEIKNKNPKKFLKIAQDKNLELKSEIEEMVTAGVLRKIGNQVVFIDEILGDTLDDAVAHLKDKKNSSKLTILRSKFKNVAV